MGTSVQNRLLLVEDSASLAAIYRGQLEAEGYVVDCAATGADAERLKAGAQYRAILLDLGLPDIDGLQLLHRWRQLKAMCPVIAITANASIATAVKAVREGAYDYLIKPLTKDRLVTTLRNAIEHQDLKRQVANAQPVNTPENSFCGFIGSSPAMQEVYKKIKSIAPSMASVFVTGESGTGKELCAEAIHSRSPRAGGPFVAINCGAIPKDLLESEIFGHLKGSFTGAIADRAGAARMADGGTLFLDEVCEFDLALQTKLLRFLQTGTIQRVGSTATETVDVRIVCATNRSPLDEVRAGRFREDLYFRLHVLPVHLPPLRARARDVLEIGRHFLEQFSREEGKAFSCFSDEAETLLMAGRWTGNVREVQNAVRQAVVLNEGAEVTCHMLQPGIIADIDAPTGDATSAGAIDLDVSNLAAHQHMEPGFGRELWRIEKEAIETAISACGGSVPKAARVLGVSPSTIYRKRDSWQLESRR